MKKMFLTLAAAVFMLGIAACNSTRDVTRDSDSTTIDSAKMMRDTTITDTNNRKVPDTIQHNGG